MGDLNEECPVVKVELDYEETEPCISKIPKEDADLKEINGAFTSKDFQDDGDWTERFIEAVQSRPAIYQTGEVEHSDRNLISRMWNEICEKMIPTWKNMSSNEKTLKEKELRGRWRNLKTCFRRELMKQKGESGQAAKKRRKYIYFDHLLFLLEDQETVSECISPTASPTSTLDTEEDTPTFNSAVQQLLDLEGTPLQEVKVKKSKTKRKAKKTPTYEESLPILKQKHVEEADEDKLFLLSLVPSFKRMNDEQKLEAKIEFLATIKRLTIQPRQ